MSFFLQNENDILLLIYVELAKFIGKLGGEIFSSDTLSKFMLNYYISLSKEPLIHVFVHRQFAGSL